MVKAQQYLLELIEKKCWIARITIGQDELGRQVRHNLGSFPKLFK